MTLFALTLLAAPASASDLAAAETTEPAAHDAHHGDPYAATHARHEEARPPRAHHLSAVVGVFDLPTPLVSASLELAVTRRLGLYGQLGLGAADTLALYDMGGGLRGYVAGDFDGGLFLGAGVGRTNFTPVSVGPTSYTAEAFVGAKYTHRIGLTIEGAAGFEVYTLQDAGAFSPTGRLGVGWSF